MNIIFYCYGGAHTSVTAANLYLGRLPLERRASYHEVLSQPGFDVAPHAQVGRLLPMGVDPSGNHVFCIGLGAGRFRLAEALAQWCALLGAHTNQLALTNALVAANWAMRIGGFLSRRCGWVLVGRPLVTLGTWLAYPRMVTMVERARDCLGAPGQPGDPWLRPGAASLSGPAATPGSTSVDATAPVTDNRWDPAPMALPGFWGALHSPSQRARTEDDHGQGATARHTGNRPG